MRLTLTLQQQGLNLWPYVKVAAIRHYICLSKKQILRIYSNVQTRLQVHQVLAACCAAHVVSPEAVSTRLLLLWVSSQL